MRAAPFWIVGSVVSLLLGPASGCVRAWVYEQLPAPILPDLSPPQGVGSLSADVCGACHVEIAAEWRGSRMAQAGTNAAFVADHAKEGGLFACLYCHTPLVEQRAEQVTGLVSLTPIVGKATPNPRYDQALADEGVTCVACHLREGALVGPHADVTPPHPFRVDPGWSSPALCETCHQIPEPPLSRLDRDIADTHREWERWQAQTGDTRTCVDCHMPRVERPLMVGYPSRPGRRHDFAGAWDDALVRSAVQVQLRRVGTTLEVVLQNQAGHAVPSGEPARAVEVSVRGADGSRQLVWLERKVEEFREQSDNTLTPAEARTLRFEVPEGPAQVQVHFHRLKNLPHAEQAAIAAGERVSVLMWEGEG